MAPVDQHWAHQIERISGSDQHLEGRRLTGPQQGFGQLWQKSFRVSIPGHEPAVVVAAWKERYGSFWPRITRFNAPVAGIKPGEVASISSMQVLSTGVVVIYADDTSFTFMTPEGHPFAGWITFSAVPADGGSTAQIQLLIRASDPIWEAGFALGMGKGEDWMWRTTLKALASYLGSDATPDQHADLVDRRRLWTNASNWRRSALLARRGRAHGRSEASTH